jgi:hypothetical protein
LINLTEDSTEQAESGVFYTDRVEIDFMSRRSLVEYFYNQLQQENIPKELIYKFVFSTKEEEIRETEKEIAKLSVWNKIEDSLNNLTVLDPACGSGSFLVGMLNIVAGLYKLVYKNLNKPIDDFEIKKQIIGRSLYGVDVMDWAVSVAELRLWLQLIVEAKLEMGELKIKPLLPNLTFKIRSGDSLVQEIAGVNLSLKNIEISNELKRKLTELKQNKLDFYYNREAKNKEKTELLLLKEELNIFKSILDEKINAVDKKIKDIKIPKKTNVNQYLIFDKDTKYSTQQELDELVEDVKTKNVKALQTLTQEKEKLIEIRDSLKDEKPFVWDIDFVEIFSDENEFGFDIIIGNPPYVRQEKVSDPNIPEDEITTENKKEYKEKLLKSVQSHYPFIKTLDKKSDLYIYFYFIGLSLVNQKGVFCFITSNSWLDVGYGSDLQEFLLNNVKIHAIYDNSAKRSFKRADVNTIIAVFGAPMLNNGQSSSSLKPSLEYTAKFIMFKKAFEDVAKIKNLLKIESATEILKTDDFRVFPKKQIDLLEEGWEYPESDDPKSVIPVKTDDTSSTLQSKRAGIQVPLLQDKFSTGFYSGNKWGGKYLRAPDIFFIILEKGKDKLVKLGDIAEVSRGFTTGVNEFFYLDEETINQWQIETEFLKPVIKSPKECKSILIKPENLTYKIFMCHKSKNELKGTNALKYIEWGEKQKTKDGVYWKNVPSVSGRKYWWSLGEREPARINYNYLINEVAKSYVGKIYASDNFQEIHTDKKIELFLNSIVSYLFQSNTGRVGFGGGLLKIQTYELKSLPCLEIETDSVQYFINDDNKSIFEECGINPKQPIRDQEPNPLPDRKELDNIVFDILGLSGQERKEVYWSVCELVHNRLSKARSV